MNPASSIIIAAVLALLYVRSWAASTDIPTNQPTSFGNIISTIAGTGISGYSGDGGSGTSAKLSLPRLLAVDSSGMHILFTITLY